MTWVNFRELREKLDFREVLLHYRVEIKAKNRVQHHGPCPLPNHQGQRRSTAFSANLDKGIWRCFGCGAQGNAIEFVAHMERLDPEKPDELRRAALIAAERYGIRSERPKGNSRKAPDVQSAPESGAVLVNAPLDFELKGLDPAHPYLTTRGLTAETIAHFELGYASRNLMQGRIAIPLRDGEGRLIGYAGRVVDDAVITDENPKYRLPTGRDRDGKRLEFSKSLFLYHGDAVATPVNDLLVVQGMPAVWWL